MESGSSEKRGEGSLVEWRGAEKGSRKQPRWGVLGQPIYWAGSVAVEGEQAPTSAYFAGPDNSVPVEIYDPSPRKALALALSGGVKPVE